MGCDGPDPSWGGGGHERVPPGDAPGAGLSAELSTRLGRGGRAELALKSGRNLMKPGQGERLEGPRGH